MIYRFHHKEISEIVEERISEEDRENTNNASTSFILTTPPNNNVRQSTSGNRSLHFDESLNISDNIFGSKELLHDNTALTINLDENMSTHNDSKQMEEEARQEAINVR